MVARPGQDEIVDTWFCAASSDSDMGIEICFLISDSDDASDFVSVICDYGPLVLEPDVLEEQNPEGGLPSVELKSCLRRGPGKGDAKARRNPLGLSFGSDRKIMYDVEDFNQGGSDVFLGCMPTRLIKGRANEGLTIAQAVERLDMPRQASTPRVGSFLVILKDRNKLIKQ